MIEALVNKLQVRGVTLITQARILNMPHRKNGQLSVDINGDSNHAISNETSDEASSVTDGLSQARFNAAVMALPHEV